MTGLGEALFDERCNSNANEYAVRGGGWGKVSISLQESRRFILLYLCQKTDHKG